MAYPTGSGSERLHRGMMDNQATSATAFTWGGTQPTVGNASATVPAHHIITLLTILVCEMTNNATRTFTLYGHDGAQQINLLYDQNTGAKGTFIWNDKVVFHPGDWLKINGSSGSGFDVHYTYIAQNWT
mgnify:FL=1